MKRTRDFIPDAAEIKGEIRATVSANDAETYFPEGSGALDLLKASGREALYPAGLLEERHTSVHGEFVHHNIHVFTRQETGPGELRFIFEINVQ